MGGNSMITRIVAKLSSMPAFRMQKSSTPGEIIRAEQQLKLTFSKEYQEYLLAFGVASVFGHELTGITKTKRLNVVEQTIAERNRNSNVSDDLYIIEVTNIDGIVIWQKSSGEIYKTIYDGPPMLICSSLSDYIEL